MKWRSILICINTFIIFWGFINFAPIIKVMYDTPAQFESMTKYCSLNYLTCINTQWDDNYPSALKTGWLPFTILLVGPLLLSAIAITVFLKYNTFNIRGEELHSYHARH